MHLKTCCTISGTFLVFPLEGNFKRSASNEENVPGYLLNKSPKNVDPDLPELATSKMCRALLGEIQEPTLNVALFFSPICI